jgi:hypothetical protein
LVCCGATRYTYPLPYILNVRGVGVNGKTISSKTPGTGTETEIGGGPAGAEDEDEAGVDEEGDAGVQVARGSFTFVP